MKLDLNELDNLQKTIRDLTILKENCVEEDKQHWSNLIDYYTSLQKWEIEYWISHIYYIIKESFY